MKAEQVDQALHQKFIAEGERLVFWHDENGEFSDYVAEEFSGDLTEVQLLDMRTTGGFSAKLRIEREDPQGKYLIYSQGERPKAEEDFLFDIRIYSSEFRAEIASLQLQELGLTRSSMREHLKARRKFLGNQSRLQKLKQLVDANDDESEIDLKMMGVLVKSTTATPFDLLRCLCQSHTRGGLFELSETPKAMVEFEKMGLSGHFWKTMRREFAYEAEEPTVSGLLRKIFVSELFRQSSGARIASLEHHQLPAAGQSNAGVFLTQWRDSATGAESYDAAAAAVAEEQNVAAALAGLELDNLRSVYTFWDAERQVVSALKDRVLAETHSLDPEEVAELTAERKAGHWLSGPGGKAVERVAIAAAYDAVTAAAELFSLCNAQGEKLRFERPADLLSAYQANLYRSDRLYRQFFSSAKPAERQGWDLLKTLAERVERVYDQAFLQPLGLEWSRLLDGGFLAEWSLADFPAQQNFYSDNIKKHLDAGPRKRAFVIISDAFRYEAAKELTESLNGRYRMQAELSAMLGVLPSYTALGMASLLPHETLSYTESGDVFVDGKSTAGTAARGKQLESVNGMACQSKELRSMNLTEAREFTEGARVVYIYHNVIDARGDSSSTESETFEAVSECIDELGELVKFCINKLNAAKVWVTADHGFLFREEAPGDTDRSQLTQKPDQAVKVKKRYVVGPNLGQTPEAHHGHTAQTAGAEGGMEFWVPRAANRFHFTGGARFVHGGAMPQEIVLPLITVTQLRGDEEVQASRSNKVGVQVLGTNHKITTPTYRFRIIQTEKVGDRRKPITLRAAVYDGAEIVTSVEKLAFDSASENMQDREKEVRLELKSGTYDKKKAYNFILRDAETEAEVQSVPVVIDRSFDDDF